MRRSALFALLVAVPSLAAPLLPNPDAGAADQAIADLAQGFQRQQDVFATAENGLSLDVHVNPADVATVSSFFQQSSDDFAQVTGRHPFSVVATFGEWGDEGNFAGVASVGVAARLLVLKRDGVTGSELDAARAAAVRAARAWHVYGSIGGAGVVARGIRRTTSENTADPPLPGTLPATVPLTDSNGQPLPATKGDTWRAPVDGGYPGWIWLDDTSKDQVVGYALAAVFLYDALVDDPLVSAEVTQDLAADLLAFARALQKVAPETGLDLSLRDADGRLTHFHDLNPREVLPGLVVPENATQNGFNATLSLAIIRAAYHLSGDEALGHYYYDDLVGTRHFPGKLTSGTDVVFSGRTTNFSNVNMLAIAWCILARVEAEPTVRAQLQSVLETAFWNTGNSRDASHDAQPWFDAVYASFSAKADDDALAARIRSTLSGFPPAPAFQRDVFNCDAAEIDAGQCLAVDGTTTITLEPPPTASAGPEAAAPVPMAVRPDSDFEWRSDPFQVNGGGDPGLMNPRGDYLAAYWLARLVDRDPAKNLSPNARPWPPPGTNPTPTPTPSPKGCGCGGGEAVLPLALIGWLLRRRRRTDREAA